MKKIEGHSKKIKISILIFLAAIFLGILVPINANAETVYTDVKYKQEVEFADSNGDMYLTENYPSITFEEDIKGEWAKAGVQFRLGFIGNSIYNSTFSIRIDGTTVISDKCSKYWYDTYMSPMVDLSPEFFKKMNHRYEIALYIDNNYYVKHYFTFYKPLKKNNTNILPKQVIGKQKVLLNWEEMIGAVKYNVYRSTKYDGMYINLGTCTKTQVEDEEVKIGKKYYYYVEARYVDGETLSTPIASVTVKRPKLLKPKIKIKKSSKTWQIYWGIISDESNGIEVYMKNGKGKYKKFRNINTSLNIKKSKIKKGTVGITSSKKSLKKRLKYKFRARTFIIIDGKVYYSKWSKTINMRT